MRLKLEELSYQREAIDAVVRLFKGQLRNTFDMACRDGVRSNVLTIPTEHIRENVLTVIEENGISEETASLDESLDFCIEMETGTGKTLVYLKTVPSPLASLNFCRLVDLEDKTGNIGYRGYVIRRISKPLREREYRCEFENGAVVVEKEKSADLADIFGDQLYSLIDSHFTKRDRLAPQGIKCAMKHFDALGVAAHVKYGAPIKDYSVFKTRTEGVAHA